MRLGESSDDRKIDICNTISGQDQDAGRAQVGMKQPVPIDLVKRTPVDTPGDQTQIVLLVFEFLQVFAVASMDCAQDLQYRRPVNELPRQNTIGSIFGSNCGVDFNSIVF